MKWIFLILLGSVCQAQNLDFYIDNKKIESLSIKQMVKLSGQKDIVLKSKYSKFRKKNYRGLPLKNLMEKVFKENWKNTDYSEIIFVATDGYQAYSTKQVLNNQGGLVTFKDLDRDSGWELVDARQANPAPFFLVWQGKKQTPANKFPWPWAIKSIQLVKFENRYPNVFPISVKKNSDVYKGYKTFKQYCFKCHAINKQGGSIGPDLGAPQNILAYRNETFVKEFIKNPTKFRYSKMTPHKFLGNKKIDQLITYLKYKKDNK
jgi:cytochrome c2